MLAIFFHICIFKGKDYLLKDNVQGLSQSLA